MRPITSRSLRGIALGVLVPAVLSSTGCYHSMGQPGYGYGSPMYGNQYQGYGGNQGIQTLTPGNYYAPGTSAPMYNSNGLQPTPDPNSGGSSSGGGGINNGDGGSAPTYSPPTSGDGPNRPVPMYDQNGAGGDGSTPQGDPSSDAPVQQNDSGSGSPTTMSNPAPSGDWTDSKVVPASANSGNEPAIGEPEPAAAAETATETETVEQTEEAEEEPPLLAPPQIGN